MSKNSAENVLSKLFPVRKSKRSGRSLNPVRRPGDDDGPSQGVRADMGRPPRGGGPPLVLYPLPLLLRMSLRWKGLSRTLRGRRR
jgi:hypothetical protein